MADLARLAPAQVAQNVMPIFTFMGTNILQRDDAQSTRVVDKVSNLTQILFSLAEQHTPDPSHNRASTCRTASSAFKDSGRNGARYG